MDRLLAGVVRYQREVFPTLQDVGTTAPAQQEPFALFITCSDARVAPHLITQTAPGDLFGCQVVGNIVPAFGSTYGGVSATIEYALTVLQVGQIVVCGHSDCGAMKVLLEPGAMDGLPSIRSWLDHAEAARRAVVDNCPDDIDSDSLLGKLTEANVVSQLVHLRTHPAVASRLAGRKLELHGWVYTLHTGEVRVYQPKTESFVPAATLLGE